MILVTYRSSGVVGNPEFVTDEAEEQEPPDLAWEVREASRKSEPESDADGSALLGCCIGVLY